MYIGEFFINFATKLSGAIWVLYLPHGWGTSRSDVQKLQEYDFCFGNRKQF